MHTTYIELAVVTIIVRITHALISTSAFWAHVGPCLATRQAKYVNIGKRNKKLHFMIEIERKSKKKARRTNRLRPYF